MVASRYASLLWIIPLVLIVLLAFIFLAGKLGGLKIGLCDLTQLFDCLGKFMDVLKGAAGK